MKSLINLIPVCFLATAIFLSQHGISHSQIDNHIDDSERPSSEIIYLGDDGKLVYIPDELGNTIPDFSNCGYMGGGVAIPDVPIIIALEPVEGDDTPRIQTAIDLLSTMPIDETGIRGTILLLEGIYEIENSITISASGIVLRGEGQDVDGTVLLGTGTVQRTLVNVTGSGSIREIDGTRQRIIDHYVPVGARSFHVEDATIYKIGDSIIVHRPSTEKWIHELGMDQIPPRNDGGEVVQWTPGSKDLYFDRVITGIDGNKITIDAPLTNALESEFCDPSIYCYEFPGRIENVGIENIRGDSEYTDIIDENHAWSFIGLDSVQNAWVRDVTVIHFGFNAVGIGRRAKWVTVQDCSCLEPISLVTGSRRYAFMVTGQLNLVHRCYSEFSRHDFVMQSLSAGPNVFLDCLALGAFNDTGPHQRWSVGVLYDNVTLRGNAINVRNRGNLGTGHGWAGANFVLWNCTANAIICESPPTAQNWAIGCIAKSYLGDGYWESQGTPVEPESLYLAQLVERLGMGDTCISRTK